MTHRVRFDNFRGGSTGRVVGWAAVGCLTGRGWRDGRGRRVDWHGGGLSVGMDRRDLCLSLLDLYRWQGEGDAPVSAIHDRLSRTVNSEPLSPLTATTSVMLASTPSSAPPSSAIVSMPDLAWIVRPNIEQLFQLHHVVRQRRPRRWQCR